MIQIGTLEEHRDVLDEIKVSSNSRFLASVDYANQVIVWDVETQEIKFQIDQMVEGAYATGFSANSRTFATIEQEENRQLLVLRNLFTGEIIQSLSLGFDNRLPSTIEFHPRESIVAVSGEQVFLFWAYDEEVEYSFSAPLGSPPLDLAFSPDGNLVAGGSCSRNDCLENGKIVIWEHETGFIKHEIVAHDSPVSRVRFSPNGRYLATSSSDQFVNVWDVETGELLIAIDGRQPIFDMVFTPDSLGVWTVGAELNLFEIETGVPVFTAQFSGSTIGILSEGTQLAVGDSQGAISLFLINLEAE